MSTDSETQTFSSTGNIGGLDVGLNVELPLFATDSFELSADITEGELSQDINVALVVDVSGSTRQNSGSDVDGDGQNDSFLEAQQVAAKALFQQLLDAGYAPEDVTVTLIEYNGSGQTLGNFDLTQQAAFEAQVDGLQAGGSTNFDDALDTVIENWQATVTDGVADDSPASEVTGDDTNLLVFLSDGFPTSGGTNFNGELNILENTYNTSITAIGVGANSSITQLNRIDNTGGAEQVTDVSQLADVIGAPPPLPELREVEIVVDGQVLAVVPAADLIPTPLGYRLDCIEISGYPYVVGTDLDVQVRAVFEPAGEVLSVGTIMVPVTPCFAAGTMILTPDGPRAVETLEPGDRVLTRDRGAQRLVWVGQTQITDEEMQSDPTLRPVRIRAGAFGPDLPERDLVVSRQHRFLLRGWRAELHCASPEGVLVPAIALCDGEGVQEDSDLAGVTYVHIAFARHEVVYSEGVETESFQPAQRSIGHMDGPTRAEIVKAFPGLAETDSAPIRAARAQWLGGQACVLVNRRHGLQSRA